MKGLTTRREALLGALGGAALLAGCGDDPRNGPHTREVLRTSIAIDYASYYAPVHDLTRLAQDRARRRGLAATFSADPSGAPAQLTSVKGLTGPRGGFAVVVIAPFDGSVLTEAIAAAHRRRIRVASFVSEIPGTDAAIGPDPSEAAARLLGSAPREATLLVLPPARSPVPDPFFGYATQAASALTASIGERGRARVTALGADDAQAAVRAALREHPDISTILTWNDATALGALAAAPHVGFIGALGAPAPTSPAVLHALLEDNAFRVLWAARLKTLAGALIDVPATLLRGGRVPDAPVALTGFHGGAETRAALADYAS
jgi:ABC-type sugar transport system substrate-binding protein